MGRRNRTCYLCGTTYDYCPTCSQDRAKPSWMADFHSEDCVKIFNICTRFNMGSMSKVEAQNALKSCDLSNKSMFKPYVQRDLEKIFAEEPKKRGKRVEIKPVDEAIVVEQEVVENAIESIVEESHEVVITENE